MLNKTEYGKTPDSQIFNQTRMKQEAMKQTIDTRKTGAACALLVGVGAAAWAASRHAVRADAGQKSASGLSAPVVAAPAAPVAAPSPAPAEPAASPTHSLSDQLIAKWTAIVHKSAGDDMAWVNLGDSYMQKARETADVTYYAHAEKSYLRAVELKPNNVPALNGLAWVNGGRHEFEKSIEWAGKAIAISSKDNDAYGLIGDADVEMGNYDTAYKHYQQMLDIRPDTSSYSRGAHLVWLMGDQRKGMWLMAKAIKAGGPFAENTAWCRAQLALMLLSTGELLPAEQTLQNALKYTPHNYQLLTVLGRVQAMRHDYPAAIESYKQAVEAVPTHDALVALGDLYQRTGRPDDARQQYALVEATRQLMRANGVRGDMQIAQFDADHDRNIAEAVSYEEAEYKTRPNVYVADTLAWCYYKAGRYQDAANMSAKALAHNTPEALFKFHAGMIEYKQGHVVDAKKRLYEALNANPNFSLLYASVASDTLKALGARSGDAPQTPTSLSAVPNASTAQTAGATR